MTPDGDNPSGTPAGAAATPPLPGPPAPGAAGRKSSQRKLIIALSVASLVVLGLVIFAVGAGTNGGGGSTPGTTLVPPADPSTTLPPSQLTRFEDPETGISIEYPKSWQRLEAAGRDVRLLLSAGGGNGVTVRVQRTEQPTTPENLANVEAFTEGAVLLNQSAKIVSKQQITLNGMPGYYYLYTFRDEETGNEGVHAHYFVFQGRKMNILVFQALPSDQFENLAPIFDQVANTFRSQPDPVTPPTAATTTTAAAATPTTASSR